MEKYECPECNGVLELLGNIEVDQDNNTAYRLAKCTICGEPSKIFYTLELDCIELIE